MCCRSQTWPSFRKLQNKINLKSVQFCSFWKTISFCIQPCETRATICFEDPLWFNPSQQLSTTQLLAHRPPPASGMGRRIAKKPSKTRNLRQRQFNRTIKEEKKNNNNWIYKMSDVQCNCSLPTDQPFPKRWSCRWPTPWFIYWAWCHMAWNIALASLGQLCWLCSLWALVVQFMGSWRARDLGYTLLCNS